MTSRRIAVFVVCVASAIGTDAFAQVRASLNEINFSASLTGTKVEDSDTTTVFGFTGAYGRFLSDRFEIGPQLTFVKAEDTDAVGTINGFAAYHFAPDTNVVPFIGALIGGSFGMDTGFSDNPWRYGFFGGIKAFIGNGGGAITIQPFWTRQNIHSPVIDVTTHVDTFGASAGISIFF